MFALRNLGEWEIVLVSFKKCDFIDVLGVISSNELDFPSIETKIFFFFFPSANEWNGQKMFEIKQSQAIYYWERKIKSLKNLHSFFRPNTQPMQIQTFLQFK